MRAGRPLKETTTSGFVLFTLNSYAMLQHGVILLLVGSMVPEIMTDFAIGESTTGILLGAGSIGFMLAPILAGIVIDRSGIRRAFLIGATIELVFLSMLYLAPVFAVAAAANLFVHFGSGFIETGANVLPTRIVSRRSPHGLMNLIHVFFSVGALIAPFFIGIYLNGYGSGRPGCLFALAPTAALLVFAAATGIPKAADDGGNRDDRDSSPVTSLRAAFRTRSTIFGAAALFFYVGAEIGVSSWVVHYLRARLELTTIQSTSGLSVLWLFILVGRYVNGIAGNRFTSRQLVFASSIFGSAAVVAFLFTSGPIGAYAALACVGLGFSGVFPNIMGELNNRNPRHAGASTAVMAVGAALGAALFQWILGVLAEYVSLTAAFAVPAALQLFVLVFFALALRENR